MIFFMYFSNKKGNQDMEENAIRILNVTFTRTEHDGHFTSIRFGGKSHIEKMRNNIFFLVVLTWLQQLQQYFYKLPERSPNQNWGKYGNYCETVLPMKTTPLENIWFAKNDGVKVQVINVDFFRRKKNIK